MADRSRTPVKATTTSAQLLDALIELGGANVTDLAAHMGLSKSSTHDHLETLEQLGFVVRDGWIYRVSLRFLEIGANARNQNELYRIGTAEVRRLANVSGVVAGIAILERQRAICLYTAVGKKSEELPVDSGETLPLHCTAPGKSMLATLSEPAAAEILDTHGQDQYTEDTLTTRSALLEELQTIRTRGLAHDREEWQSNLRGIASAVTGADGDLLGTIFVMSSPDVMSGKRFQQDIPGLVISSANRIAKKIRQ